eukprot:CAMPEP_0197259124 /NCGR_PEP_ID=MMETSP1429-20130617/83355_1 /TAXON_ID=49237 /ORGANISM="Chaetoceros  sp., Strain UNC1202" /LENGTH=476 /DNA_ID=CAMNT_0042723325 /DNA_START=343 /DNA_END=1773 /DNA_ORIENTATION=-
MSVSPSSSAAPSSIPSITPSLSPSASAPPSSIPSITPSLSPSASAPPSSIPSITPSLSPSASFAPSISPSITPSVSPSASFAPSISPSVTSSPSVDCKFCQTIRTCSIQPDPHYTAWDNSYYDFHGGCDQYAVKNDQIEIQIATRPRTYYSTITQISVVMLASGEYFKIELGSTPPVWNFASSTATVTATLYGHQIDFASFSNTFIRINEYSYGFSLQIEGIGALFSDSEGMCGSWNHGGVRLADGTSYNTAGAMAATAATSFPLAQSWNVPSGTSKLLAPSALCDASRICTATTTPTSFACTDTRRRHLQANPNCSKTCDDIPNAIDVLNCKQDVLLTGDTSFACQQSYLDPVFKKASPCDFVKLDDEQCARDGKDKCGQIGGQCIVACEDNVLDGHVCLPGICSVKSEGDAARMLKADKAGKGEKEGNEPKVTKGTKVAKGTKGPKKPKKPKMPTPVPTPPVECMCMAPQVCPK